MCFDLFTANELILNTVLRINLSIYISNIKTLIIISRDYLPIKGIVSIAMGTFIVSKFVRIF